MDFVVQDKVFESRYWLLLYSEDTAPSIIHSIMEKLELKHMYKTRIPRAQDVCVCARTRDWRWLVCTHFWTIICGSTQIPTFVKSIIFFNIKSISCFVKHRYLCFWKSYWCESGCYINWGVLFLNVIVNLLTVYIIVKLM